MAVSRSKRQLASTASCAALPISFSTASMRAGPRRGKRHRSSSSRHCSRDRDRSASRRRAGCHPCRVVVTARGINEDTGVGLAALALGQQAEERLARDFRHGIQHRHVDGADRTGPNARPGPTGLSFSSSSPDPVRAQNFRGLVDQVSGAPRERGPGSARGSGHPGRSGHIRIEAVAHHAPPSAHHIGNDRTRLAVISKSRYRRCEWGWAIGFRDLTDFDNAHGCLF